MTFSNYDKLLILGDLQRLDVLFGETHARNMLYETFDVFTGNDSIEVDIDLFYLDTLFVCLELCNSLFGYHGIRQELIYRIEDEIQDASAQVEGVGTIIT